MGHTPGGVDRLLIRPTPRRPRPASTASGQTDPLEGIPKPCFESQWELGSCSSTVVASLGGPHDRGGHQSHSGDFFVAISGDFHMATRSALVGHLDDRYFDKLRSVSPRVSCSSGADAARGHAVAAVAHMLWEPTSGLR